MITREWPPEVYGGAGVHVTELVKALKKVANLEVSVHCFGASRSDAQSYFLSERLSTLNPALSTLLTDADIAFSLQGVDLVHSHTWYTNFVGFLARRSYQVPHIITAHSLEPDRPWKAEQLGGGYQISSWIERVCYEEASAIIAVSEGMKRDIIRAYPEVDPHKIHTILNGVDTNAFQPSESVDALNKFHIDFPYALFVGRITRQKGLAHLLRAWRLVPREFGLVIAASTPDEAEVGAEVEQLIHQLQQERPNVIWIPKMLLREELLSLLTHARTFACPSIYEPLGIVNLEAMACQTAVVASAVGGIPEVVRDSETGILVSYSEDSSKFEENFAQALIKVLSNAQLAENFGVAGRARAIHHFSWDKVAEETHHLYRSLI
jgi:starch synthase